MTRASDYEITRLEIKHRDTYYKCVGIDKWWAPSQKYAGDHTSFSKV